MEREWVVNDRFTDANIEGSSTVQRRNDGIVSTGPGDRSKHAFASRIHPRAPLLDGIMIVTGVALFMASLVQVQRVVRERMQRGQLERWAVE
ncbi:MAG: hypothetical protein IPG10_17250 [Flavobacteriales bacterium]|nr:hypothetical protein [Flavobacteriales bacterium]MBK6755311.1 hypothetical protein [Flavobacteriales bacterium]MBK7086094.1 hypothetical protein [Flavobacteriales bacterium]MBK7269433.1 hypothetical protein [Flavobacteriales bacterium]MBK7753770.1 hypothetical protein [Flavobacteriales bacterium]